MKPIGALLESWEPKAMVHGDPMAALRAAWPGIVGDDIAANTRPSEMTGSALLVLTRSPAWSQQLAFLSERITQAVCERTGLSVERLRFRTGRLMPAGAPLPARKRSPSRAPQLHAAPAAATAEEAFDRFKAGVTAAGRAKKRAGWKECRGCGARTLPVPGSLCAPCENERLRARRARVARLLFDAPWLGFGGVAALVDDLTREDYESIRLALLRRWKDALDRVLRSGGGRITVRDRMTASSYVLLKSEIDPEQIAPAVVRDLLGDELHDILYGTEASA
jgi:hypothetical protein